MLYKQKVVPDPVGLREEDVSFVRRKRKPRIGSPSECVQGTYTARREDPDFPDGKGESGSHGVLKNTVFDVTAKL
jgi:hypothetical protein